MSLFLKGRGLLRPFAAAFATIVLAGTLLAGGSAAQAQGGAVFTSTNTTPANCVAMFRRQPNGALNPVGCFYTGGAGTGAGLGNQGAVVLSPGGNWLFAVNAGSNDISVFAVRPGGLRLMHRVSSGGVRPVSLTLHNRLLYVLNAGAPNNITGFTVGGNGNLTLIPGSTQALSGPDTSPAQVGFDPFGGLLVVTERATQNINVFPVDSMGAAGPAVTGRAAGVTPFGFGFDGVGRLFVAEANAGVNDGSTVSSYYISRYGLLPISAALPTNQSAACWLAVSRNGNFVWTGNAGNANSVSAFAVAPNGILNGLGVAASGLSGCTDLAIDSDNRFLYALENRTGSVRAFRIRRNGSLELIGSFGNLGAGFTGLAAN